MLPPCPNRFNNDNDGCSPIVAIGILSGIKIAEVLDYGFITTFILVIAGTLISTILGSYLKK